MAVRSVTDRTDFTRGTENTSRLDLNVDRGRNDDSRNLENFEDGDFPA